MSAQLALAQSLSLSHSLTHSLTLFHSLTLSFFRRTSLSLFLSLALSTLSLVQPLSLGTCRLLSFARTIFFSPSSSLQSGLHGRARMTPPRGEADHLPYFLLFCLSAARKSYAVCRAYEGSALYRQANCSDHVPYSVP